MFLILKGTDNYWWKNMNSEGLFPEGPAQVYEKFCRCRIADQTHSYLKPLQLTVK